MDPKLLPLKESDPLLHSAARWLIASYPQPDLSDPQETIHWRQHRALGVAGGRAPLKARNLAEEIALLQKYVTELDHRRLGHTPLIAAQLSAAKAALQARNEQYAALEQLGKASERH